MKKCTGLHEIQKEEIETELRKYNINPDEITPETHTTDDPVVDVI